MLLLPGAASTSQLVPLGLRAEPWALEAALDPGQTLARGPDKTDVGPDAPAWERHALCPSHFTGKRRAFVEV